MSATAQMIGAGFARYFTLAMTLTGQYVNWYTRNIDGNLSGYEEPIEIFSGPVTLQVRLSRPRTNDEIIDPTRMAGYTTDQYWTMLYPSSASVTYRDIVQLSTSEGVANFIVTQPTRTQWGNVDVIAKTTIRRLVNISAGGFPLG